MKRLIDSLEKKIVFERLVIGLEEPLTIKGLGQLKAKVDSGNGGYNVIHGKDFQQEGDLLTFTTTNGNAEERRVQYPIVDYIDVNIGGGNVQHRPVVEIDVKFGGEDYSKVRFSVTDRSDNTNPVLISKSFVENELDALIDVGAKNISKKNTQVEVVTEADETQTKNQGVFSKVYNGTKNLIAGNGNGKNIFQRVGDTAAAIRDNKGFGELEGLGSKVIGSAFGAVFGASAAVAALIWKSFHGGDRHEISELIKETGHYNDYVKFDQENLLNQYLQRFFQKNAHRIDEERKDEANAELFGKVPMLNFVGKYLTGCAVTGDVDDEGYDGTKITDPKYDTVPSEKKNNELLSKYCRDSKKISENDEFKRRMKDVGGKEEKSDEQTQVNQSFNDNLDRSIMLLEADEPEQPKKEEENLELTVDDIPTFDQLCKYANGRGVMITYLISTMNANDTIALINEFKGSRFQGLFAKVLSSETFSMGNYNPIARELKKWHDEYFEGRENKPSLIMAVCFGKSDNRKCQLFANENEYYMDFFISKDEAETNENIGGKKFIEQLEKSGVFKQLDASYDNLIQNLKS